MRALPANVPPLDARSGFRVAAPRPLVPAEHFAGTHLEARIFAFYGEAHALGPSIDWDTNPGTAHWGHDLNRFGFLLLYEADPGTETADRMLALIEDWLDKNGSTPPARSPYAWQNLLNVAIRIENWWRFIADASRHGHFDPASPRIRRIALATAQQTLSLLRMIRTRGFRDNWSLIGLRAALYVLYAIEPFPKRHRLIAIAHAYLRAALSEQILPDGTQQELSPHYHWVALELIASIRELAQQAEDRGAAWLEPHILAMRRVLDALISPSSAIVALGDSDADYGARIREFLDETAAVEQCSLLESDAPEIHVFPYAGLASIRHRATQSLLVFDGGPYGTGHQHEDALGLWLSGYSQDLIVDPGRYLYERGAGTFYAHLRSTAAHSTIRIDGQDQNAAAAPERWRRSTPGAPDVELREDAVALSATFSEGYGPERIPVLHRREITVSRQGLSLHVRDTLIGEGAHDIELLWLVSPGSWTLADRRFQATRGKARIEIACPSQPDLRCRVAEGERAPFRGWYSPRLNVVTPTPALVVEGRLTLPAVLETVIHVDDVTPTRPIMTSHPAVAAEPAISVVINTNGRCESLRATLEALRFQTHSRFEICLVCGPGRDGTHELAAELAASGHLKTADCAENNLSVSRNLGIALAGGEFVAFIDDDAIPEPVWLEQLLAGFDTAQVAGVSGTVFQPNGRDLQFRFSSCDRFGHARHDLSGPADASAFPLSAHFPHVMGTNAMFRRQALVAIGGFDEEYDYYLDEADLCCRLVDAGYLIRQRGDAPVHHKFLGGTVRDGEGITVQRYPILKNQLYFALLNGRSHAPLPEILDSARDFAARHRSEIAEHVARGTLHAQALAAFDADHDRAWSVALARGLSGERRRPDARLFDAPPGFPRIQPWPSAARARRHVVIVVPASDAGRSGLEQARIRAEELAQVGQFARILACAAARSREGVELQDGVWHHYIASEAGLAGAGRTLAAALERISAYHPVDAVEDPEGCLQRRTAGADR